MLLNTIFSVFILCYIDSVVNNNNYSKELRKGYFNGLIIVCQSRESHKVRDILSDSYRGIKMDF